MQQGMGTKMTLDYEADQELAKKLLKRITKNFYNRSEDQEWGDLATPWSEQNKHVKKIFKEDVVNVLLALADVIDADAVPNATATPAEVAEDLRTIAGYDSDPYGIDRYDIDDE